MFAFRFIKAESARRSILAYTFYKFWLPLSAAIEKLGANSCRICSQIHRRVGEAMTFASADKHLEAAAGDRSGVFFQGAGRLRACLEVCSAHTVVLFISNGWEARNKPSRHPGGLARRRFESHATF